MVKTYRDKAWVLGHERNYAANHVFEIQYCRARTIHSTDVTYWFKRIWGTKKCLWQDDQWH